MEQIDQLIREDEAKFVDNPVHFKDWDEAEVEWSKFWGGRYDDMSYLYKGAKVEAWVKEFGHIVDDKHTVEEWYDLKIEAARLSANPN